MQPLRVLLVEDNPADAELTRDTLESGKVVIDIEVVVDGAQALAYLRREPPYADAPLPDLVLLDLNLPKLSGREVLAEMRKQPALRALPVVVLTSSDAEQDILRSYELGANCYVTKPVGLEAFQSIVRAVESFWFTVVKLP
ncbi:MAG TPA: response regulator [Polyangiaceae bacterium]|nr:response regulator [Polyangiaceae bacterium]